MSYSRVWTDVTPVSTDPASGAPIDMQHIRVDLHERIADVLGIADFTTDPIAAQRIRLGYAGSNTGGFSQYTSDDGNIRWLAGVTRVAGGKSYYIYDAANSATRLDIDAATGLTTIHSGLTIAAGGLGIAAGNFSVSSGNIAASGSITGNGSIHSLSNIIADTGLSVGGAGLSISAGGFSVTGNSNITGTLSVTGTISGNVTGNLTGNVTGNLTGNVTGNVSGSSGSCTGNAATATFATNAGYATSAGAASTATNATNSSSLGGVPAGSYALLSGASFTGNISASGHSVSAAAFYVI